MTKDLIIVNEYFYIGDLSVCRRDTESERNKHVESSMSSLPAAQTERAVFPLSTDLLPFY